jgi:enoyl-CoA hydratase
VAIDLERQGKVATIILSRPEVRNAIDRKTAAELFEAFQSFEEDEELSVAVLWGEGWHFCAGADLRAIAEGRPNVLSEGMSAPGPMGPTRMRLSKPVIAAISGYAVAGGLELALWCDLRVAEIGSVFGVFNRRFGVPLIDGGTYRLPRLVGMGRALDMILTGRPVEAKEALQIGLIDRLVEKGNARVRAEELACGIAAFPQACLRSDREAAYGGWGLPYDQAMEREFALGLRVIRAGEAQKGAAEFLEGQAKRRTPPNKPEC